MESKLKPYDEYQNTGYDWIPAVPKHWSAKTIRAITKLSDKRNKERNDLELLSVYREYGVIKKSSRSDNHNVESQDLSNYKCVNAGYLVMNKMKMWQGSLGISKYEGIVSPAYIVCEVSQLLNGRYLHYLLRSATFKTFYNRISYGVRVGQWDMRYGDFKSLRIYLPPDNEQDQIVRYLDWKLSRINKIIRGKKQQTTLLREKIITMTNYAISADNVNKQRLVNISYRIGNWIKRQPDQEYTPIGLLNRGRGLFHKPPILGMDLGDSEFYGVEDKALIFSGQFAWEGAVALTEKSDRKCIASHRYHMICGKEDIVRNEYLWAFFQTKYGEMLLNLHSRGAAGRNRPLNINSLLKEHIPLPSIEVQEQIAKDVRLLLNFSKSVIEMEKLLYEYRTTLISGVVTGKVDVRNVAIENYSEEEIELEEIDELVDEIMDEEEFDIEEV